MKPETAERYKDRLDKALQRATEYVNGLGGVPEVDGDEKMVEQEIRRFQSEIDESAINDATALAEALSAFADATDETLSAKARAAYNTSSAFAAALNRSLNAKRKETFETIVYRMSELHEFIRTWRDDILGVLMQK